MPIEVKYLLIAYFSVISLVAIIVTVSDKIRAKTRSYRTPEARLLFISAIGGSVAMLFTMLIIHHKTQHKKFMMGIPVIILVQLAIAATVCLYY